MTLVESRERRFERRAGVGAELLAESVGMRNLRGEIATAAVLDATVLIEGETGTGKELVARAGPITRASASAC